MSKSPWARVYPYIPAESDDQYGFKRMINQIYYEAMVSDYFDRIGTRKCDRRKVLKKKRKKHGKGT